MLQGISPWGQEGFASSDATLPCVPPPLPRRICGRSSARFPTPMLPSPYPERLGFRIVSSRGLRSVRYLRPTRSLPSPGLGLSGDFAPRFRIEHASSASWFWLLPCWDSHPLGYISFSGHTGLGRPVTVHLARDVRGPWVFAPIVSHPSSRTHRLGYRTDRPDERAVDGPERRLVAPNGVAEAQCKKAAAVNKAPSPSR